MHYGNPAVTDAGHTTMVHALRHEWETDDMDDQARHDSMAAAMGDPPPPAAR